MSDAAIRNEIKVISISQKRQLTIPQKFFTMLGFSDTAECCVRDGELVIRPAINNGETFADMILEDLISQGFSGAELLAKFKEQQRKVRPAVERMIEEADTIATTHGRAAEPADTLGKIFD